MSVSVPDPATRPVRPRRAILFAIVLLVLFVALAFAAGYGIGKLLI